MLRVSLRVRVRAVAVFVAVLVCIITVPGAFSLIAIGAYKPTACIDQSHDFRFMLAWSLRDFLTNDFNVTVSHASLDQVELGHCDLLVIPAGDGLPFTEVEKQRIATFVSDGRSLLLVGFGLPRADTPSSLQDLVRQILPAGDHLEVDSTISPVLPASRHDQFNGHLVNGRLGKGQILAIDAPTLQDLISTVEGKTEFRKLLNSLTTAAAGMMPAESSADAGSVSVDIPAVILPENHVTAGNFTLHFSDHLRDQAHIIVDNLSRITDLLTQYHGQPLAGQWNLLLVPTAGSGYASNAAIGVGVLGDEATILSVLAHELTHVWVQPAVFPSSFNEGWASLAAIRAIAEMGYTSEAQSAREGYAHALEGLEQRQGPLDFYVWPQGPPQEQVPSFMGKAMAVIETMEGYYGPGFMSALLSTAKEAIAKGELPSPLGLDHLVGLFTQLVGDKVDVYGLFRGGWYLKLLEPAANAIVKGQLPVRLGLPPDTEAKASTTQVETPQLSSLTVELDDKPVYTGQVLPHDLTIDTLALADGLHTLRATAESSDGRQATVQTSFVVRNWWELVDDLLPPLSWFGSTIDRSVTASASQGWRYATDNSTTFAGDEHRLARADDTSQYLIWSTPGLRKFHLTFYVTSPTVPDYVSLSVSQDGQKWHTISYLSAITPIPGSAWFQCELSGELPAADEMNRFKLELLANPYPLPLDGFQLGKARFTCRDLP